MIDRCCISINEACDMRCKYCHFDIEGRRSRNPAKDDFDCLVDNIISYIGLHSMPQFKVGIVGGGEPMLRFDVLKHLVEKLESCGSVKMYTISNGLHLTDDQLDFLYLHRDSISFNVSLDGYQELHDLYRFDSSGRPTFDRIMDNIDRYEDVFGSKPQINCTVTPNHILFRQELLDFFVSNGFNQVTFSRLFDSDDYVSEADFNNLLAEASRALSLRQIKNPQSFDCCKYGKRCGVGRTNVYFASGKAYPCARFSGLSDYDLGSWSDSLDLIENRLHSLEVAPIGVCYYDSKVVMS